MKNRFKPKDESKRKPIRKSLMVDAGHAERLNEFRSCFGWSARRAACFILAYTHKIDSIVKDPRYIFDYKKSRNENDELVVNLFLPMTPKQSNRADDEAKKMNFDFRAFFKINLDHVYRDFKAGKLDFNRNEVTKKFIDENSEPIKQYIRKFNENGKRV
jgi:hypothetical protein